MTFGLPASFELCSHYFSSLALINRGLMGLAEWGASYVNFFPSFVTKSLVEC